jgi:hypothetical protein
MSGILLAQLAKQNPAMKKNAATAHLWALLDKIAVVMPAKMLSK